MGVSNFRILCVNVLVEVAPVLDAGSAWHPKIMTVSFKCAVLTVTEMSCTSKDLIDLLILVPWLRTTKMLVRR